MDSKQFAWFYLIENGQAGLQPSYYGGYSAVSSLKKEFAAMSWDKQYSNPFKERFLANIKTYGVDWEKTSAPESTLVNRFQGTFCDSKQEEMIEGTLVLRNGQTQYWSGEKIEVSNVFEMMAEATEAAGRAAELFNI